MKRLLLLLISILAAMFIFSACSGDSSSKSKKDDAESTTVEEVTETTEAPVATYEIKTKYAVLKYPEKWKDSVKVSVSEKEPYTVSFSADKQPLFTYVFNGTEGDLLGTIIRDDGNVVVRIKTGKLDKKAKKYDDYAAMQEDLNVILQNLAKDYKFVYEEVESNDDSVYEIKTDFATLYYPQRWKDKVTVKTDKNQVQFSSGKTPLFTLSFGGNDGILLGTYDGKELRMIDYPLDDKEMANMQEDVNVILEYLRKDEKFEEVNP